MATYSRAISAVWRRRRSWEGLLVMRLRAQRRPTLLRRLTQVGWFGATEIQCHRDETSLAVRLQIQCQQAVLRWLAQEHVRGTREMGVLIDGVWTDGELPQETGDGGRFKRAESRFGDRFTADGSSGFKAEPGRYHLYVAHGCPWAHRTLIYRALKKLDGLISVAYSVPGLKSPLDLRRRSSISRLYSRTP